MAIQCKMCGSGMPDDAENCKVCGNSLAVEVAPVVEAVAAPAIGIPGLDLYQSGAPMSGGTGEMRIGLNGEPMEVAQRSQRGSGPGGFGPPPTPATVPLKGKAGAMSGGASGGKTGPLPAAPVRRHGIPAPAAEEAKGGGVPVWVFAIILVVLAGVGIGAFMFMKKQAPVKVAQQVGTALAAADWGTVYDIVELPAAQKATVTKEVFTQFMTAMGAQIKMKDPKVGSANIDGETATVPLTLTVEGGGKSVTETKDVSLKMVNGQWKVDGSKPMLFGGSLAGGGAAPGGQ